ncbi:MAG: glutamine amidotransferase [Cyanobacteria bacterium J06638_22]
MEDRMAIASTASSPPSPVVPSILVVVHQKTSTPGLVGTVLRRAGFRLDIRCPAIGQPLPASLANYAGAVVFGGPMSANDDSTMPFIRAELDWIAIALESGKPYLGICLGAQLLARVLGAQVAPRSDERMEVGYCPIEVTAAGQPALGHLRQVFQWHREGFALPAGTTLLATSTNGFPNQAYRYGDRAYGLQFHPEITRDMIERWTVAAAHHLRRPEAQPRDAQFEAHAVYGADVERWLTQFLSDWAKPSALAA